MMLKFFSLIPAMVILLARPAGCQSPVITPEYIGSQFVRAINSTDSSQQAVIAREIHSAATLEKNGADRLVKFFQRMHGQYAPMEYHHAELLEFHRPSGDKYVLHIYARKEGATMWSDFQLYLEPNPPHRIDQLVFVAEVAEPISLPNGSIEQAETLDWLNRYIEKLQTENDLAGSILIAKKDQPLFAKNWGSANLEQSIKIDSNTVFGLASGSKMFTALAILQLQEQGKLSLEDPLTNYFPDFPQPAWAQRVRLIELLSHTSGIREYWTSENEPAMLQFSDWHQFLPLIYKEGFQFEPGTAYQYSNSNFMLLGRVIEIASGQDYYDYIEANILKKAGMIHSGWFEHADSQKPQALPYARKEEGGWKIAKHFKKGSPAGGCYSNASDMLAFSKALKNNVLVSAASLAAMRTDRTSGLKDAESYGLGLILQKHAQEYSYGHGGTAGGVNFEFRYFPRQDILLVVFCNQNNGAYDDLKRNSIKLISGER